MIKHLKQGKIVSVINKDFLLLTAGTALLAVLSGCTHLDSDPSVPGAEFAEAKLVIEQNATDGDAELIALVRGKDEGIGKLRIYDPDGAVLLDLSTQDSTVGLRVFSIESAEPGVAEVIRAYPEGRYRIEGVTISGAKLYASTNLSHKFPAAPKLKVNNIAGTITWSPSEDAVKYIIELERQLKNGDEIILKIELPTSIRLFSIPKDFLVPGDYQVGLEVHGKNGNIVVVEQELTRGK